MKTYKDYIETPPNVFISYSWTSEDHINRVLELSTRLRQEGVNVKIDKWYLKEGQDKYKFMESMVSDESISKVLMICDKTYAEKANKREGGVGEETQIITPKIYKDTDSTKFIPIIFERDNNGEPFVPNFLDARIYIDYTNPDIEEKEFDKLLRSIYDRPENEKPPLGLPPTHIFDEKSSGITKTDSKAKRIKYSIIEGQPRVTGLFEDYLHDILSILDNEFSLNQAVPSVPFDDRVVEKINEFLPYRKEYIDLVNQSLKYKIDIERLGRILHEFFEKLISLIHITYISYAYDQFRFITWELFLHTIALVIKRRSFNLYDSLTSQMYLSDNNKLYSYHIIWQSMTSLDNDRKKRLNLHMGPVTVNELRNRTSDIVSFLDIMQADLILFLKSTQIDGIYFYWYPNTLSNARNNYSIPYEFFLRAEEEPVFQLLLQFIGFTNKEGLRSLIEDHNINSYGNNIRSYILKGLTNFDRLGVT